MGLVKKVAEVLVSETTGKILEKRTELKVEKEKTKREAESRKTDLDIEKEKTKREAESRKTNLDIEREKTRREAQAHQKEIDIEKEKTNRQKQEFYQRKADEESAEEYKLELDLDLARTSITYLLECIDKIESQKQTYKYKTMNSDRKDDSAINEQICRLIAGYQIPRQREEFIFAADTILPCSKTGPEIVRNSWKVKWDLMSEKAKIWFPNDKEIKEIFWPKKPLSKKAIGAIIGVSIGVVATIGLVIGIAAAIKKYTRAPDSLASTSVFVEYNYSHFKGTDYHDVQLYFEEKGFRNVQLNPLKDLIILNAPNRDLVETVSINDNSEFTLGWFDAEDKVIISYHSLFYSE